MPPRNSFSIAGLVLSCREGMGGRPMRPVTAVIAFFLLFSLVSEARGAGVDLEVILAADVSRSIDDAEFDLQRKGYAAALTEPRVLANLRSRQCAALGG